jgi:predicted nucleic acid-binding protein
MPAFWDASALVPLCLPGPADPRARRLLREQKPVVWWGTPVEMAGAFARLRREGHLTPTQAESARTRLDILRRAWLEVQPIAEVRELAEDLIERRELRAADALQLAAALVWCNRRPARRHFICQDRRLRRAASEEGFITAEL